VQTHGSFSNHSEPTILNIYRCIHQIDSLFSTSPPANINRPLLMGQKKNSQCSSPACIHFSYAGVVPRLSLIADIATTPHADARFTQTLADLGAGFLSRAQAVSFWIQPVAQPAAPHTCRFPRIAPIRQIFCSPSMCGVCLQSSVSRTPQRSHRPSWVLATGTIVGA
jgi:hypothetical protein